MSVSFLPYRSFTPHAKLETHDEEGDLSVEHRTPKPQRSFEVEVSIENTSTIETRRPSKFSIKAISGNVHNTWARKNSRLNYSNLELGTHTEVFLGAPRAPSLANHDPLLPPLQRQGWRKGILWASAVTALVLLFNTLFLAISSVKYGTSGGVGTLFQGGCGKASRIDSGFHFAINIMSTVLLGASNYVMQILNAPTRKQVDKAHAKNVSLLIGVPNFRNLGWVGIRRSVLWLLLAVSALPLHLLWNSTVFSTLQSNQYNVLVVSNDFVDSTSFDCNIQNLNRTGGSGTGGMDDLDFCGFAIGLYGSARSGAMEVLDNEACMKAYSVDFLSGRRNLLAISKQNTNAAIGTDVKNGSIFTFLDSTEWQKNMLSVGGSAWLSNSWICSAPDSKYSRTFYSPEAQRMLTTCDTNRAIADASNWELGPNVPIDHCLSEKVPEVCQLQFILPVMIIVIVCNAVKLICMVFAAYGLRDRPLVVIGDAVASFLESEDVATEGQCLAVAYSDHKYPQTLKQRMFGFWSIKEYQLTNGGMSRLWASNQNRWFTGPGAFTWISCIMLCLAFLGVASAVLRSAVTSILGASFSSLAFSSISPSTLITWFNSSASMNVTSPKSSLFISLILITNLPQLIFSILYFLSNTLYTSMLSASELIKYSRHREPLRVSYPTGIQRSTYWLQLPFRYSIPLLISSSLLHFFTSQSLYIARVYFFDAQGQPVNTTMPNTDNSVAESNILTLPGYSPKALIAAIAVGVVMLLTLVATGLRKFDDGMPVIGNDSWAISAACHPIKVKEPEKCVDVGVKWGVIALRRETGVGRCCFTRFSVEPPIIGGNYA